MRWFLLGVLLWPGMVWADDIVVCDPADALVPNRVVKYLRSEDAFKSGAVNDPNALIYSLPASPVRPWNGVTPGGEARYWKCAASDVVAMSQAEKDALDAPDVAAAALAQSYMTEITGNTLCEATLTQIDTAIDGLVDPVSNLAEAKTAMKVALKKVSRCVRARAR